MKKITLILFLTLVATVFAGSGFCAEFHSTRFTLRFEKGLLYLNAYEAPCDQVLTAIQRLTSIPIEFPESLKQTFVTLKLNGVKVEEAVRQIVSSKVMVFEKKDGILQLTRAMVISNGQEGPGKVEKGFSRSKMLAPRSPTVKSASGSFGHRKKRHKYVPGELVVRFKKDLSPGQIREALHGLHAHVSKKIPVLNYVVISFPREMEVEEIADWFQRSGLVDKAEPNYLIPVAQIPDDPKFDQQWSLFNTGQLGGTPNADISAPEAWEIETGSTEVVVAVIDTGVDYNHSDLSSNIWHNPGEIPDNEVDDDNNGFIDDVIGWDFVDTNGDCIGGEDCSDPDAEPMDLQGHGTKVAGIFGAVTNNNEGMAGVAWNCKVMVIRAGFKANDGTGLLEASDAAAAIMYAAKNGASVLNLSWGDTVQSDVVADAVRYALDRGLLVCTAAGNNGNDTAFYPAAMVDAGVVAVGATGPNDELADFSNFGGWVDVAAPGNEILTTTVGGFYGSPSGTSMATPHVSGLAALILSHYPGFKAPLVQDLIFQNVDVLSSLDGKVATSGRINGAASLELSPENRGILTNHFSSSYGSVSCALASNCEGDMDGDGDVDGLDLSILSTHLTP